MALNENLEFARRAVQHVTTLGIRPSNHHPRFQEIQAMAGRGGWQTREAAKLQAEKEIRSRGLSQTREAQDRLKSLNQEFVNRDGLRRLDGLPPVGVSHTRLGDVMRYARAAQATGFGNCGEQACLAFLYLWETPACRPVEVMQFSNRPDYDHMWVVIGRTPGREDRLSTWGADAVWCDPWQGPGGKYFSIQDFINNRVSAFPPLSNKFKLDSVQLVEAGLPRSFFRSES